MANSQQFIAAARQAQQVQAQRMRQTVAKTADRGVALIRRNIPPGATPSPGMPNRFPGYAATGRLKSQFVRTPVVVTGNTVRSTVKAAPRSPLYRKIMMVHERGATIRARSKPYLVFQINGQWVRTKQVRIRPKYYFRSAYQQLRREAAAGLTVRAR